MCEVWRAIEIVMDKDLVFLCDKNTMKTRVKATLSILLLRSFRFQSTNLSKLELPLVIGYAALTLQPNAKTLLKKKKNKLRNHRVSESFMHNLISFLKKPKT